MSKMKLTGAQIVWKCLEREGVDTVFGYPGGCVLPLYDALQHTPSIHHVLVRHEQGAAHMADGYSRATGKVGVALATSGPGATNLVTGIATAMLDSSPIVCITGQVGSKFIGTDAFQEIDITGITMPITKHNYMVTDVNDIARTLREAFIIARTGRPGPVLVDITKDAQMATCDFEWEFRTAPVTQVGELGLARSAATREAAALINRRERPVILAGHGILMSGAMHDLQLFAEASDIPVGLTLLGLGAMPHFHPCAWHDGRHGEAWLNDAIQNADLLIALGMRFDDRVTGKLDSYAQNAKKVHVDIDASEIHKNVHADVAIVGDLKHVLPKLIPLLTVAFIAALKMDSRSLGAGRLRYGREGAARCVGRKPSRCLARKKMIIVEDWNRSDPLVPNEVRYQATLHSEFAAGSSRARALRLGGQDLRLGGPPYSGVGAARQGGGTGFVKFRENRRQSPIQGFPVPSRMNSARKKFDATAPPLYSGAVEPNHPGSSPAASSARQHPPKGRLNDRFLVPPNSSAAGALAAGSSCRGASRRTGVRRTAPRPCTPITGCR